MPFYSDPFFVCTDSPLTMCCVPFFPSRLEPKAASAFWSPSTSLLVTSEKKTASFSR